MGWKVTVVYENGAQTVFTMRLLSELVKKLEDQLHDYPIEIVIKKVMGQ